MRLVAQWSRGRCGVGATFGQRANAYRLAVRISIQGSRTFCRRFSEWHAGARLPRRPGLRYGVPLRRGHSDRLPALAEEIVGSQAKGDRGCRRECRGSGTTAKSVIPIVSPALADAVHLGLITSEARPGGNVTGIEPYVRDCPPNRWNSPERSPPAPPGSGCLPTSTIQKPRRSGKSWYSRPKPGTMIAEADMNSPDEI